ncbi:MAG: DMT family transporter [Gemmataceae bacterium]|nr:DMT family transporter [Gemmataceae bacterium]
MTNAHPTRPYVWMLAGSFAFAVMAEFAHVLNRSCDWQAVAVARAGLVALFAGVIAAAARAKLVFLRPRRLWVRSLAGSGSMVFTFYAFGRLPAADVLTLTNTFPIWVAVLSWPLTGRPPSRAMVLAILAGVVGVVLVEQPHLEAGNAGVYAALIAAVLTAVAMLGLHSLRGVDPRAIVVHFSVVATVVCSVAYLVGPRRHDPAGLLGADVLLQLAGMAAAATVGQFCLTMAFGAGTPARVSVVGLTQIVMALGFDAWLWGRAVDAVAVAGTLLVIAPTAWLLTHPAGQRKEEFTTESQRAPGRQD